MRKKTLFKRWQRYLIALAILCIVIQFWRAGNHSLWPAGHEAVGNSQHSLRRSHFQTGVIFPQWGTNAYSAGDTNWRKGLNEIQEQTAAQWVSMTINFFQASISATRVEVTQSTPTPQAVSQGITLARAMGYHVFIQPLITVQGQYPWAGSIHFTSQPAAQAWFDSYWQTYRPYILASAQAGAAELSIGNEYELIQGSWTNQWNELLARVHGIFPGALTYGMRWVSVPPVEAAWMSNPLLSYIGVTVYIPLTSVPERLPPAVLPGLWREKIGKGLDAFAMKVKKPILISEIGYRDSPDALYEPWANQTLAGKDPQEQAAAYNAALQYVMVDPHITGIFIWAWSFQPYQPNEEPASQVLHHWYALSS